VSLSVLVLLQSGLIIGESGDYGGWFCPCHGSHYDICIFPVECQLTCVAGRARKGPAPLNLEIPEYDFADENTLVIG
jgi:ubiquinol-cytochrome c reductase iron-sulfur subunit